MAAINELKSKIDVLSNNKWTFIGNSIGSYNFSQYDEILIVIHGNSDQYRLTLTIPVKDLDDSPKYYMTGTASINLYVYIYISKTAITDVYYNANTVVKPATAYIYGKK